MNPCHHVSTGWPPNCWTRKSVASSLAGSGWNQSVLPDGSRIIGPFCTGPYCGVRKMSPLYSDDECRLTVIDAGSRSGREWKCWTPFDPAGTIGIFIGLIVPNGTAIAKWNEPLVPPVTFSPVVTVTVSPAVNGWLGMKLPPCPSESASIEPLCAPELEPTTVM